MAKYFTLHLLAILSPSVYFFYCNKTDVVSTETTSYD